jgi:hypothetical protein
MGDLTVDLARIAMPAELAKRLREAYGLDTTPATLGDVAAGRQMNGWVLRPEQLYSAEPTRHAVQADDATRYTYCIMDALMLPILTGETLVVRSQAPTGETISLLARPDEVEATAPGAVVSYGLARAGNGNVHCTVCPYINVFPSREAYERWAAAIADEAVTMALPLAVAAVFARAIASGVCC